MSSHSLFTFPPTSHFHLPTADRPSPLTTSSDSFSLIFSPHLLSSPNMSSLSLFTFPPTGHLPSPTTAIGLSAFVVDSTG
ncbi:hypothetical protein ACOSP7_022753 [Xanthoceras sorbifolium]